MNEWEQKSLELYCDETLSGKEQLDCFLVNYD